MKMHIGTKAVTAKPMTRAEYNEYRGWALPQDENGEDWGYLVEYQDGGKTNDLRHDGYISWSPKEQFDKAYTPTDAMTFGHALEMLKAGHKVARAGWNGKGMWLVLVPGTPKVAPHPSSPYGKALMLDTDATIEILPHIDMWTTNSEGRRAMLCGWLASQTDMLAEDWSIV